MLICLDEVRMLLMLICLDEVRMLLMLTCLDEVRMLLMLTCLDEVRMLLMLTCLDEVRMLLMLTCLDEVRMLLMLTCLDELLSTASFPINSPYLSLQSGEKRWQTLECKHRLGRTGRQRCQGSRISTTRRDSRKLTSSPGCTLQLCKQVRLLGG
ncbi:hypothetical protein FHG87_002616 [Trinorchestia longiramus]|nr:hypothetical protein FHG87_002616 [Trinorchestia longiramus]